MAADSTRRAVLAAAATLPLLAAGCNGVGALAAPPRPAPDVALLQTAITAEELMVARYQAAISSTPGSAAAGLAAELSTLLGQHHAHLAQLRSRLTVPAGSPYQPREGARGAPVPKLPAAPQQLAAYLAAAERQAAARLERQLLSAPPSLAQLLASISAAEATHVPVLTARQAG